MSAIFISYRREDNPDAAGRIYDRLKSHFGESNVFFDIDSIPPGVDFRIYISDFVSKCDALVVIIGEKWLATGTNGKSRLEDTSDFVRIEIETALNRNIPVIPVPVRNAKLPSENELPDTLIDFCYRNAFEVRSGTSFEGHIQRLIRGIEASIGRKKRILWKAIVVFFLVFVSTASIWILSNNSSNDGSNTEPLKKIKIRVSQAAPDVAKGERASIYIKATDANRKVIEDATVIISAGGGKFLKDENTKYDPQSMQHGPYSIAGKTNNAGVFTAWWVCNPCAKSYGMSFTISKDGYEDKTGELAVRIR